MKSFSVPKLLSKVLNIQQKNSIGTPNNNGLIMLFYLVILKVLKFPDNSFQG